VPCILPGHDDRSASLSLDLGASVFNCFGCGRSGGLKDLRVIFGESHAPSARSRRRESPLQEARRAVMQREERLVARRAEWIPYHHVSAYIGRCFGAAHRARSLATQLGADDPRAWAVLERAVDVERDGLNVEAELDAILASGRLA
jgi:hypothetical protein